MRSKINISIDDISPHPKSSLKVLEQCNDILNEFPDAKFTLFVPMAYWRTQKKEVATEDPLCLHWYPEFCEQLRKLPKDVYEIGYHGLFHGVPEVTDNDEFDKLGVLQTLTTLDAMQEIAEKAGLLGTIKPIFRPPAWRMSSEAISACKMAGLDMLCLTRAGYALAAYKGADKTFGKVSYSDIAPPNDALQLMDRTGLVYHACECDKNYLGKGLTKELVEFLKENKGQYEFTFIEGINEYGNV